MSTFFRVGEESVDEAFQRGVEEVLALEELGFDSVWLIEALFSGEIGFNPPPLALATHLLGKTTRIRVGTAVAFVPLHHPIELAHYATGIDQLSQGRFDLGVARGASDNYADSGYGAVTDAARWRGQYGEALEVLARAIRDAPFSFDGEYYRFSDATLFPRSYQLPHLPIWGVAQSEVSFAMLGAAGYNLMIPLPGYHGLKATWSETAQRLANYRDLWARSAASGAPQVVVRCPCFVGADDESAQAKATRSIENLQAKIQYLMAEAPHVLASSAAVQAIDPAALAAAPVDELIERITITGGPETVINAFRRLESDLGATGVMLELVFMGTTPRDDALESAQILADRVIPKFR